LEGTFTTDYRFTGQKIQSSLGSVYHMGARFYDASLNRWLSADTIVPGTGDNTDGRATAIGYDLEARLVPLTVGFHEAQFIEELGVENREEKDLAKPTGPTDPQSLNRYSYVLNNALRYIDPTGHVEDENSDGIGDPGGGPVGGGKGGSGGSGVGPGGTSGSGSNLTQTAQSSIRSYCSNCSSGRTSPYEIGQRGQKMVFDSLNDPAAQEEVRIYVGEAGRRANYFARLDILTETAIHEVKNVAQLSLSQGFKAQATRYYMIAESAGWELHYWLLNSAPPHVVRWLEELGAIVHTGIPVE
jgi:RHS repeat-associated protein